LVQLQAAGLFDQPTPQTTQALYQRLQERSSGTVGVDPRWLAHSLRWLADEGWLATDGDTWRVQRVVAAESAWAAWDSALREAEGDADRRAQAQLVDACLRALPAVLSGRLRATEVMFPEGSMARVEGIYKHNAVSDYFNEVITQAVLARVRAGHQAGAAPVRILEIGAGTGGTSARVLQGLDSLGVEVGQYAYTDLSRAFLMHAQTAYGEGRSYLDYRILDVEKDLVQQGLELGSYDVVIATNVLHATADIRQVVEHAKAALKTDGWLLLNELSQASLFSHLTFGLLEGWWRYRDEALRLPGTPGLSSERWQQVLEEAGYRGVMFPCQAFHGLGQQVVMAR
ncbi:class I SAM-dependent methyltransferase, partial [Pseudomonas sp. W2Aug9]